MDNKTVDTSLRLQLLRLSKHGQILLKSQKYAEALKAFKEALLLSPGNLYFMTRIGDTLRRQKEFSAAVGYYLKVLEMAPSNLFALRGYGDALRGLQQYEEAIETWKKCLSLNGHRNILVLTRIADCYKTLNNYEDSLTYYKKALAVNANNRYALIGLAGLYQERKVDPRAIEFYDKALTNGMMPIKIMTIAGNLHYRHGNYEQARGYYEKALVEDPENSYALYGLGNYYRWKSHYRRSVELWEKILKKNDGPANLLSRIGDAYRNLGQYDAAERAYINNLDNSYNKFSIVGMIKLRCLQVRLNEACEFYDVLLSNEGEDRKVFADVARLLIQRNEQSLALQFLRHVLQRQKDHPVVSFIIDDRIRQLEEADRNQNHKGPDQ